MTYTVQPGDNLSKIAKLHGVTVDEILAVNPQITNPNLIRVGDVITIPSQPEPEPEPEPQPQPVDLTPRVVALEAAVATHGQQIAALNTRVTALENEPDPTPEPPEEPEPTPEPPADPGYIQGWGLPTWRDEFNGPNIDTSKWTIWTRAQHGSLSFDWGILTADNAFIENGQLHLRISRRTTPINSGGKDRWWDTAALDANGKFNTGFGRWEMRAKTTASRVNSTGMWCAFWLRNAPDSGEIDIMESWGNPSTARTRPENTVDTSSLTLHENTNGTGLSTGRGWEAKAGLPSPYTTSAGFHTWVTEFTPTSYKGFFDGKLAMHATRDGAGGTEAHPWIWGTTFDSPTWYPRLNHAMGDPYWSPDPDHTNPAIVTPRDFVVDYIRYWKMP